MFRALVSSDEAVKAVFDHFRNLGIAGAVLASGFWVFANPTTGITRYIYWSSGISLIIMGIFLFLVADNHGRRKFREANISKIFDFLIYIIYALGVFMLFVSTALRMANFKIQ